MIGLLRSIRNTRAANIRALELTERSRELFNQGSDLIEQANAATTRAAEAELLRQALRVEGDAWQLMARSTFMLAKVVNR